MSKRRPAASSGSHEVTWQKVNAGLCSAFLIALGIAGYMLKDNWDRLNTRVDGGFASVDMKLDTLQRDQNNVQTIGVRLGARVDAQAERISDIAGRLLEVERSNGTAKR